MKGENSGNSKDPTKRNQPHLISLYWLKPVQTQLRDLLRAASDRCATPLRIHKRLRLVSVNGNADYALAPSFYFLKEYLRVVGLSKPACFSFSRRIHTQNLTII